MIAIKQLSTGYWHIRGNGPCNWAQPPNFPCDEDILRAHAFPEASETFIRAALRFMETWAESDPDYGAAEAESAKCPKCGTAGEHYCPAEVARE